MIIEFDKERALTLLDLPSEWKAHSGAIRWLDSFSKCCKRPAHVTSGRFRTAPQCIPAGTVGNCTRKEVRWRGRASCRAFMLRSNSTVS